MNVTLQNTNIIILYGDGATSRFTDMIRRWNSMLSYNQWNGLQFILAGCEEPALQLDDTVSQRVNDGNTRFFHIQDAAPDESVYYSMIYDKVSNGRVNLHLICDPGEGEASYRWAEGMVRTAFSVQRLTTTCFYYFLFGWKSREDERKEIIHLLQTQEGAAFLLGDSNENGGFVRAEDRWHATELAVLLNAAGALPVRLGAYSLGYASLNANGSELNRMCESTGCRALQDELEKTVSSLAEAGATMNLLPRGMDSIAGMREWLKETVRAQARQPKSTALHNAWITIRMDQNLSAADAVKRMRRFADLNYAGNESVLAGAKETAWKTEADLKKMLRYQAQTASLSPDIFRELADNWRREASRQAEPEGCVFPKQPLLMKFGKGIPEYVEQCKGKVMESIRKYIEEKNISYYAGEMAEAYERLAAWVENIRGTENSRERHRTAQELLQEIRKDLDSPDSGNVTKLNQKYKNYAQELNLQHPTLSALTEGMKGACYSENGALNEKNWRELVRQAGKNVEKRLSSEFRGDFFKVLNSEFSTREEREKFFDEYLKSGPRMYGHLRAQVSSGTSVLLADERLTDSWFTKQDIFQTRTDNAENLTVYPLGGEAADLLQDGTVYFRNTGKQTNPGGIGLFGKHDDGWEMPKPTVELPGGSLFGNRPGGAGQEKAETQNPDVRLEPNGKGEYRLYWKWHGNDETAMVELFQYGEQVGRVAVIPVRRFKDNGDNMNVTEDILQGKPVPAGILTVTIRDAQRAVYVDGAEVKGRREVIRYKVNNRQLQLKPENHSMVEKLVLRTTDPDGSETFYPLYAAGGEKKWLYEGLQLSDGRIVTDPTQTGEQIYAVSAGD